MEQVGTCREQSAVPEHDRLDGRVVGQHGHDGAGPGGRGEVGGDFRTPSGERLGLGPVPVPDGDLVTGRHEIIGHARAHLPEPNN